MINVVCDSAMLAGFVAQLQRIPSSVIEQAAADLRLKDAPATAPHGDGMRGRWSRRLWFRAAG